MLTLTVRTLELREMFALLNQNFAILALESISRPVVPLRINLTSMLLLHNIGPLPECIGVFSQLTNLIIIRSNLTGMHVPCSAVESHVTINTPCCLTA